MVPIAAATRPKTMATLRPGVAPLSGTHTSSSYRAVAHNAWGHMSALCRMPTNYSGERYTVKQYNGARTNQPGRKLVQPISLVGGPHGSRTSLKGMTSGSTAPSDVLRME